MKDRLEKMGIDGVFTDRVDYSTPEYPIKFGDPIPSNLGDLESMMHAKVAAVGASNTETGVSVTGEPYIEFARGIILDEIPAKEAEVLLCKTMWFAFCKYLHVIEHDSTTMSVFLYWRLRPEIVVFDRNKHLCSSLDSPRVENAPRSPSFFMRIYMRYLLSTLPVKTL